MTKKTEIRTRTMPGRLRIGREADLKLGPSASAAENSEQAPRPSIARAVEGRHPKPRATLTRTIDKTNRPRASRTRAAAMAQSLMARSFPGSPAVEEDHSAQAYRPPGSNLQRSAKGDTADALLQEGAHREEDSANLEAQHWSPGVPSFLAAQSSLVETTADSPAVHGRASGVDSGGIENEQHLDDVTLIGFFLKESKIPNQKVKKNHALHLRKFAVWLRKNPGRPTLMSLVLELVSTGVPARKNKHVMDFRQDMGSESALGKQIASAVDALVTGGTKKHPDDENTIRDFLASVPEAKKTTGKQQAKDLRHIAAWLRNAPAPETQGLTLASLAEVVRSAKTPALENQVVQNFRRFIGPSASAYKGVASAVDALAGWKIMLHQDDKNFLEFYSSWAEKNGTADVRAANLRHFSRWLRAEAERHPEKKIPTIRDHIVALAEKFNECRREGRIIVPSQGSDAVSEFRKSIGLQSGTGRNITSAIDNFVRLYADLNEADPGAPPYCPEGFSPGASEEAP